MSMPTWERRYYLSKLIKNAEESQQNNRANNSTKGRRVTKIGGDQLKNQMMSGKIPLN